MSYASGKMSQHHENNKLCETMHDDMSVCGNITAAGAVDREVACIMGADGCGVPLGALW